MNPLLIRSVLAAGAIAVVATVAIVATNRSPATKPLRPIELLHAQRFTVQKPFQHVWRAEKPFYNDGWLLVLSCDPIDCTVQQVKQPVLYVGMQTADRMNFGEESGNLVVIVPGDFKLEDAEIFFGGIDLPEEVLHEQIEREVAIARQNGIAPHTAETIASVLDPKVLAVADDYQLRLRAIDLVEEHSPQERDLISGWRVPLVPAVK